MRASWPACVLVRLGSVALRAFGGCLVDIHFPINTVHGSRLTYNKQPWGYLDSNLRTQSLDMSNPMFSLFVLSLYILSLINQQMLVTSLLSRDARAWHPCYGDAQLRLFERGIPLGAAIFPSMTRMPGQALPCSTGHPYCRRRPPICRRQGATFVASFCIVV